MNTQKVQLNLANSYGGDEIEVIGCSFAGELMDNAHHIVSEQIIGMNASPNLNISDCMLASKWEKFFEIGS